MVEMSETANILHNATANSLVLLDEIGRGTSTFDGLAIAWATAEYLATRVRAFTLFATHYFELTGVATQLPAVGNVHLAAVEHDERIVFLHRVQDGPTNRSYGIQVARLAGLPDAALELARRRLELLESGADHGAPRQPDLFAEPRTPISDGAGMHADAVHQRLAEVDPDALTPRAALEALYELKALATACTADDVPLE